GGMQAEGPSTTRRSNRAATMVSATAIRLSTSRNHVVAARIPQTTPPMRYSRRREFAADVGDGELVACFIASRVTPNGSRLSCGRPARRRKAAGRSPCPARGTTLRFPLERLAPASFKRLLGGQLPCWH